MMRKWLTLGLIIYFLTCAECQEPDDSATRKYEDELFKTESTDINTTLGSTEIENNSTTTESNRPSNEGDAPNGLDEDDELSNTRDGDINEEEDVTQTTEWTTIPEEHEYSISIKDVFEKSIDVVKDEMKGIGIIQSWLKEKADEFTGDKTTADYDYTQSTDDYTDVYDDEQTGVNQNGEVEEVQKENEFDDKDIAATEFSLDKDNGKEDITESIQTLDDNTLKKIEDDLEKLNKVQKEEEKEIETRDELLKDIEKNLNKLEATSMQDLTTEMLITETTEKTTEFVEFIEVVTEQTTESKPNVVTTEKIIKETTEFVDILTEVATEPTENKQETIDDESKSTTQEILHTKLTTEQTEIEDFTGFNEETTEDFLDKEEVTERGTEKVTEDETEEVTEEITETINIIDELSTSEPEIEELTEIINIVNEIETTEATTTKMQESIESEEVTITISDERTDLTEEPIDTKEYTVGTNLETSTIREIATTTTNTDNIPTENTQSATTTEHILQITENTTPENSVTETASASNTTPEVTEVTEFIPQETTVPQKEYNSEEFLVVTQSVLTEGSDVDNNDRDITLKIIPVRKIEEEVTTILTTTESKETTFKYQNSEEIVDDLVDEIIDEIKEIELTTTTITTTEDPTKILLEETVNLTKTIDEVLLKNEKSLNVLKTNSIQNNYDFVDLDELAEDDKSDVGVEEIDENQDIEKDTSITSWEEETVDDIDMERKKVLSDRSDEDNILTDVDHKSQSEEEVTERVSDLKVSALIKDHMNGNVCLNASGLSIKITNNNLTYWVPPTSRVLGECTTFGAYLNFTWKIDAKEHSEHVDNYTLSFTFIGDDEESYIEEVILKTNKGNLIATQLEKYLTEPTIITLSKDTTITMTNMNVKLNRQKHDYATISLLSVDNALALQIAAGGLCLFIVLIGVSIYSYRKLRSQARVFKVSLDK